MTHPAELEPLLRLPQVLQLRPLSDTRLYHRSAMGRLARPGRMGANAVAWPRSAVSDYLELIAAEQAAKAAGGLRGRRGPAPRTAKALKSSASAANA